MIDLSERSDHKECEWGKPRIGLNLAYSQEEQCWRIAFEPFEIYTKLRESD